jgi:23S rRNA (adenine2503-C2)-methyltransferase
MPDALKSFTDLPPAGRRAEFEALGLAGFRADQVAAQLFGRGVLDYAIMTDLPASLRRDLAARLPLMGLALSRRSEAAKTTTSKILLEARRGGLVEAVAMRDGPRLTFCLSSQIGCAMGCRFCASGLTGLERSLTAGEIVDQFLLLRAAAGTPTNIVFMGMGEPLANLDATLAAMDIFTEPAPGIAFGARRITVSTVGLVPGIRALAAAGRQAHLALSLHAADDVLRKSLIKTAGKWSNKEIMEAVRDWSLASGRMPTIECVLLHEVNDRPDHARALAKLAKAAGAKVNLIPYNPAEGLPFKRPPAADVKRFAQVLKDAGLSVTTRVQRGADIDAACGQLRRRASAE